MLASARTAAVLASSASASRRAASTLALKYSKAAFGAALAKSPQTLNKVAGELAALGNAIKSDPALKEFVSNPTLSSRDRAAGLETLYAKAGGAPSETTKNLISILVENGRLNETPGVIEGFAELVAKHNGELTVTVTSAAPLPKDVQTKLEASLKQSQAAQQAKSLKITNKVCAWCLFMHFIRLSHAPYIA
jgi:F-type H+-transporting ATPase subunit O